MRLPASPGQWEMLLLLLLGFLLANIHCEEVFGILGENYTFPVKINETLVEIIWTKNKDKIAEWEEQSQPVYFPSLRNRGSLNNETGSLTIFNLEKNDTATYALEYLPFDENNPVLTFILTVLDPPSEPTISCNVSDDHLVLTCAADFKGPLAYSWDFSSITDYKQWQNVVFLRKNVDPSEKVTCFVEVSQTAKRSEFSLAECFPGEIPHRSRAGLIVACCLTSAALILMCSYKKAGCPFRKERCKRRFPKPDPGDEEKKLNENCQEQSNPDISDMPKSSPSTMQAAEHDVKESDASQVAGDGNWQHLDEFPDHSEEDISDMPKSSPNTVQAAEHDVKESGVSQVAGNEKQQHLDEFPDHSEEDLKS